jgi:ParB-like chromosome segregation protein Spo0J
MDTEKQQTTNAPPLVPAPGEDAEDVADAPRPPPAPARVRRAQATPALLSLDRLDEDTTFQLRPEGDLSLLATDIARLGQLFPVDVRLKPPDRFQVICGFRRVAALRFLQRERVVARLHANLSDEDALLMALADVIHAAPIDHAELEALKARLDDEGRLGAEAKDMLEKALSPDDTLAPEMVEEEIDAEELAMDATARLGELNQDLALLADVFTSLDEDKRQELLEQLRYASDLVTYLEGL